MQTRRLPFFIRSVILRDHVDLTIGMLLAVVFAVIFVGAAMIGWQAHLHDVELNQYGVEVRGRVLDKWIETSTDSDGNTTTSYYVQYEYDAGFGDPPDIRTGQQSISREMYDRLIVREQINVTFSSRDRDISRVQANGGAIIVAVIFGILGIIPLYFILVNSVAWVFRRFTGN